jgi:hypothetical protein
MVQADDETFDAFLARGGVADVWHVADTPKGVVIVQFTARYVAGRANEILSHQDVEPSEAVGLAHAELAGEARAELDFPEDWVPAPKWNSALSYGEPHPHTMAKAVRVLKV